MNTHRSLLILVSALALTVSVSACSPPVTTYTAAEAPKDLKLDTSTARYDLRFAPSSAALAAGDAARLHQLASTGAIGPNDRVLVAAAGSRGLAEQRYATVAAVLLHYGIVPVETRLGQVPPERAVVGVTRTLVTLPPCPNWSKSSSSDFGNQPSSNFGCANAVNFGQMVAYPTDLASGLPSPRTAEGVPAASAMSRYLNDKVQLPTANTALPIAAASAAAPASTPTSGTGSQ
jgi:pilus assembly protein CpaD